MIVAVPYAGREPIATRCALIGYAAVYVDVGLSEFAYCELLASLWSARGDVVIVEHDVIPWPGAIESLVACPEPWCAFDYQWQQLVEASRWNPPLGCVKITGRMMAATIDAWREPVAWQHCDVHLVKAARTAGLRPHQHFPNVTHVNPLLLGT